jgi:hypothetical protein
MNKDELYEGLPVRYVPKEGGAVHPATVVRVVRRRDGRASLRVDFGAKGESYVKSVPFDAERGRGTWHFLKG